MMGPKPRPAVERIKSRSGPPDPNGCVRLAGADARGYPRVRDDAGRSARVSRVLLAEKLGRPIGPGLLALHSCPGGGNAWCVAEEHLYEGTQVENMRDRRDAGRYASGDQHVARLRPEIVLRGERNPCAKLTEADVREIRAAYARGETLVTLAERFRIVFGHVSNIVNRRAWAHVA